MTTVAILLYDGVAALDAIGPYEALWQVPDTRVCFVAERTRAVSTDSGSLRLQADYALTDVPAPDILVVPGSSVSFLFEMENEVLISWIQSAHRTSRWTTSVCSGALILAKAGILTGLPATTNWALRHQLSRYGAVPVNKSYVVAESARVITAAGVSSGIELGLYLASRLTGNLMAEAIQLMLGYDPSQWILPFPSSGSPESASLPVRALAVERLGVNAIASARANQESFVDILRGWFKMSLAPRPNGGSGA